MTKVGPREVNPNFPDVDLDWEKFPNVSYEQIDPITYLNAELGAPSKITLAHQFSIQPTDSSDSNDELVRIGSLVQILKTS